MRLLTNTITLLNNCQDALEQGTSVSFQQSWSAANSTSLWQCNSQAWMSESKMSKAGQCWQRACMLSQLSWDKRTTGLKKKNLILPKRSKPFCVQSPEQESEEGQTRYESLLVNAETKGEGWERDWDEAVSWWLRDFPWAVNQTLTEHILCILTSSPSMAVIFISKQCLADLASGKRWRQGGTQSNTYSATVCPLLHLLCSALSLLRSPLLVWNHTRLLEVWSVYSKCGQRKEWRKKREKDRLGFNPPISCTF